MALWLKDATSRAPNTVFHRAEPAPDGLVRVVFNPEDGVIALVHNQVNGGPATLSALESLLEASGGISGI